MDDVKILVRLPSYPQCIKDSAYSETEQIRDPYAETMQYFDVGEEVKVLWYPNQITTIRFLPLLLYCQILYGKKKRKILPKSLDWEVDYASSSTSNPMDRMKRLTLASR